MDVVTPQPIATARKVPILAYYPRYGWWMALPCADGGWWPDGKPALENQQPTLWLPMPEIPPNSGVE